MRKMRKSGTNNSFDPWQIGSWVVVVSNILVYILCLHNLVDNTLFNISLYLLFAVLILLGLRLTFFDATAVPLDIELAEEETGLFCETCNIYVNKGTKHCGKCKKCTEGFDHHCKWLNNCIGSKNYRYFILLIFILQITVSLLLVAASITVNGWFVSIDKIFIISLGVVCNSVILFSNSFLIGFHVYLHCFGMTTYEYIKKKWTKVTPQKKEIL